MTGGMDLDTYAHFLVVDLEATCSDDGSIPAQEREIIEIGAVMVEASSLTAVGEYSSFVRPVLHAQLTPFCTKLTGIRTADVSTAPRFAEVLGECAAWARSFPRALFCSWGDYDRRQLEHDCTLHGTDNPFGPDHLNLKRAFAQKQGLARQPGMKNALARASLALEGRHHRGIDDARNIARLLPFALGKREV
jgi:inhibitor of KinA sporulation pathway (predicted exonuclease)